MGQAGGGQEKERENSTFISQDFAREKYDTSLGNRTKVHRASSSSPTQLYKPQGAQHDYYEEESQAMATFRKQAHVEETCHTRQLLWTQKDKDEVWALSTR